MKNVHVMLDVEDYKRLRHLAQKEDFTISGLIRAGVKMVLKKSDKKEKGLPFSR